MRKALDWIVVAVIVAAVGVFGMIETAQAAPVNEPVITLAKPQAPPCKFEDGSTQRSCVWDASDRVNKRGHSFLMRKVNGKRTFRYISHRKAERMITRWREANCLPMEISDDGYPYTTCTGWKG